jgi:hypothetical protein
MAEKSGAKRDEETGRRLSPEEVRAQDEAKGQPEDGSIMLTNDSGNVKRVPPEEWENEERQAQLLRDGWKEMRQDEK